MRLDPITFAVTLATMWAAHDFADHVVQTHHQSMAKVDSDPAVWVPAMVGHVGGYQLTQAVALATTLPAAGLRPRWWAVVAGTVVSAASHAFLDRRWPVKVILQRTGSAEFAELQTPICGMYQADQALHHACLWLAALVMAVRR